MRIDPAIAALRDDEPSGSRAPQRSRAQALQAAMSAAHNAWLDAALGHARAEFDRYARGEELACLPALHRLVSDHGAAKALVDAMRTALLAALRTHPLGEVPMRYRTAPGLATLQLLQAGRAVLSVSAYEPLDRAPAEPRTAVFVDRESREIVVSGAGEGSIHTLGEADHVATRRAFWRAGDTIATLGAGEARELLRVKQPLIMLQLSRDPLRPAPAREITLERGVRGTEVQRASGDKSASEALMAAAVLGAMGHRDALSVLRQTALAQGEDADLRWEAVRQSLALDARAGGEVLCVLAQRAGDPLSAPAAALAAQLADILKEAA